MEGALALALPLKIGQYLSWKKSKDPELIWNAMKPDGIWFQAKMSLPDLKIITTTDENLAGKLVKILAQIRKLNNSYLKEEHGYEVQTILEFDPDFGFGSSSTLISNLAGWAEVDPYELLGRTFGGSGYDIACARSKKPLFYRVKEGNRDVLPAGFSPPFADKIFFVYLGKKQVSSDSVAEFKKKARYSDNDINRISEISKEIERCTDLLVFENLLDEHEVMLSDILGIPTVKSRLFENHRGAVKSLGAWGGDFVLMTYRSDREEFQRYLESEGYPVYYTFQDLISS
jgi:mevalonate kinase